MSFTFFLKKAVVVSILITLVQEFGHHGVTCVENEATILPIELGPLARFKKIVSGEIVKDFMRKDVYLVKWLRAKSLNVKDAVEAFRHMLNWRKEDRIDDIFEEDFTDFEREFPFNMDAHDYSGRPVGSADIADWDVRKIILTGRVDRAVRFVFLMAEIGIKKVDEVYEQGHNVTTGILLANLDGFNRIQHACSECIPVYQNLVVALENYYPGNVHKLIGVNTPMTFYPVFRLFSPLLSKQTREVIKFYGTDKRQWIPQLLKLISVDQLEPHFGGTRIIQRKGESEAELEAWSGQKQTPNRTTLTKAKITGPDAAVGIRREDAANTKHVLTPPAETNLVDVDGEGFNEVEVEVLSKNKTLDKIVTIFS